MEDYRYIILLRAELLTSSIPSSILGPVTLTITASILIDWGVFIVLDLFSWLKCSRITMLHFPFHSDHGLTLYNINIAKLKVLSVNLIGGMVPLEFAIRQTESRLAG